MNSIRMIDHSITHLRDGSWMLLNSTIIYMNALVLALVFTIFSVLFVCLLLCNNLFVKMDQNRHTVWHTGMHYKHLLDTPQGSDSSLKIRTQTRVCLSGGKFSIHCLTCSSSEGKWVEISAHCPHGENPFGCNCVDDPSLKGALSDIEFEMVTLHL